MHLTHVAEASIEYPAGKRFFYYPPTVSQIVAVPKSYPLSDKSQLEFDESARRAIKDLVVRKDLQSTVSNSVDVVGCGAPCCSDQNMKRGVTSYLIFQRLG